MRGQEGTWTAPSGRASGGRGREARARGIDFGVAVGRVRVRSDAAVAVVDLTARVEPFLARPASRRAG